MTGKEDYPHIQGPWDVVIWDVADLYDSVYRSDYNILDFIDDGDRLAPDAVVVTDVTVFTFEHPFFSEVMWPKLRKYNLICHASLHKLHMLGSDRVGAGMAVTFSNGRNPVFDQACTLFAATFDPHEDLDVYTQALLLLCLRDTPFFQKYVLGLDNCVRWVYQLMAVFTPEICPTNLEAVLEKGVPIPYIMVRNPKPAPSLGHESVGPHEIAKDTAFTVAMKEFLEPLVPMRPSLGFRTPYMDYINDDLFRISLGMDLDLAMKVYVALLNAYRKWKSDAGSQA
jgi:hypothetical protein